MNTVILKAKSKENLELLVLLAKKLGIEVSFLTEEAMEDIGLAAAIEQGKTGEFVDVESFMIQLNRDFTD
jgi:hypothetical protein